MCNYQVKLLLLHVVASICYKCYLFMLYVIIALTYIIIFKTVNLSSHCLLTIFPCVVKGFGRKNGEEMSVVSCLRWGRIVTFTTIGGGS